MAQRWSLVIHRTGWEGQEDALAELLGVYSTTSRATLRSALMDGQVVLKRAPSKEALEPLVDRLLPMGIEAGVVADTASDTEPTSRLAAVDAPLPAPDSDTRVQSASEPALPAPSPVDPTTTSARQPDDTDRGSTGWGAILGDAAPSKAPSLPPAPAPSSPLPASPAPTSPPPTSPPEEAPFAGSRGEDMRRKLDALAIPVSPLEPEGAAGGARRMPSHVPALSAFASFVAPGCGQAINGEPSRGLLILLGSPLVLPWIYGIFEAGKHAGDMRDGRTLMSSRRSPGVILGFLFAGVALWVSAGVGFAWIGAKAPVEPATFHVETPAQPPSDEAHARPVETAPLAADPARQQEERRERRRRQEAVHRLLVQARSACNQGAAHRCLQMARHILEIDPVQREARTLESDALLLLADEFGSPLEHDHEEGVDPLNDTTPPAEAPP